MPASNPARAPSPPRSLPTAPPELLGDDYVVEEETLSWYNPDTWYPVKIGEVFESRYQVLLKLGFGSVSTAWLCRDLREHKYVTVKVYETGHRQALNEFKVLQHLATIRSEHPGRRLVRLALDSFELPGKVGSHVCIVHEPLGHTYKEIREMAGGKFAGSMEGLLRGSVYGMLLGLDFLHSVARVVHTDIQEGNIMLSLNDDTVLDKAVNQEWANPGPRKIAGDREIYVSATIEIPDNPGVPVISDFGDAQFGEPPFCEEVMPDLYRSPEIVLGIAWDEKTDIWAFGLMVWDLFEGKHLFNKRLPSRKESSPAHLATMISLLGPPPADLLERGGRTELFFDDDGNFKYDDLLSGISLESEEENLEEGSTERAEFLAFIRRMLQWRPEDRASAAELLQDPWLRGMGKEETEA